MSKEETKQNDNFHLDKSSVSCNLCRCGRKAFHKETKTTIDKEGNTVVNQAEERSSWRVGGRRGTTPDDNNIFKTNIHEQEDVDTVDTGFGSRKPTPEERLQKLEETVEELKKHHQLSIMD